MKILIDHSLPFRLAHGGVKHQIEQTKKALEALGQEVEYLQWWRSDQSGDLIHHFGLPSLSYVRLLRERRTPLVITHFLSATCNRSNLALRAQGLIFRTLFNLPGWNTLKAQTSWPVLKEAPLIIVGLECEKRALQIAFDVAEDNIRKVPLGTTKIFNHLDITEEIEPQLICVGTICEVKQSVELAEIAIAARVPILFIGKPFLPEGGYWNRFASLIDNKYVRFFGHLEGEAELASVFQRSRGLVLFSKYENWSLVAHEASACGLPLLLPNQNWAQERFKNSASFWPQGGSLENKVETLRKFYAGADGRRVRVPQENWEQIALKYLLPIYEDALIMRW